MAFGRKLATSREKLMKFDLVFEGGGAKGIVFAGAIDAFLSAGHTYDRLLGTSAGAITAALLAAGYTSEEMLEALKETDTDGTPIFTSFMGKPDPFSKDEIQESSIRDILRSINLKTIPDFAEERFDNALANALMSRDLFVNLFAFIERGGWFSADNFLTWMRDKLNSGANKGHMRIYGDMTLKQFYDATEVDLTVVAADTSATQLLVLNHRTAPDLPLVYAVRMSMSIPLLWDEVVWKDEWGTYRGRDMVGHCIVDGGLLSSFPLELFVSKSPQVTAVMGPKTVNSVLGMLIDETAEVADAPPATSAGGGGAMSALGKLRTVNRIRSLVDTMTLAHDKEVIEAFHHIVVRCPAKDYGTTEFDMSDERRTALVNAGRVRMQQFMDNPPRPRSGLESLESIKAADDIADRIAIGILSDD